MAKSGGTSAIFLMDGYDFLAPKLKTVNLKVSQITEQTDGLGDAGQACSPVGKQRATLTQGGGFWDTAALNIHDAMATKLGSTPSDTPRVGCVGVFGNTVSAAIYGIQGLFSVAYEGMLEMSKLTKANAEHLMDGLVEKGGIVQPLTVETADWDTAASSYDYTADPSQTVIPITSNTAANPSVVTTPVPHKLTSGQVILISGVANSNADINGQRTVTVISPTTFSVPVNATTHAGTGGSFVLASTVNGGAGYQQVTAFSGFSGYIGKIQHSPDNSTWADLAVFSNVTSAPNAQRVAVSAGTTVNRYLRHFGDITGSGSTTVLSIFARA